MEITPISRPSEGSVIVQLLCEWEVDYDINRDVVILCEHNAPVRAEIIDADEDGSVTLWFTCPTCGVTREERLTTL